MNQELFEAAKIRVYSIWFSVYRLQFLCTPDDLFESFGSFFIGQTGILKINFMLLLFCDKSPLMEFPSGNKLGLKPGRFAEVQRVWLRRNGLSGKIKKHPAEV